jgi:multimeric flavodoxin WrbA
MKFLILMGSPRINGNTVELCRPFIQTLEAHGAEVKYIPLAAKTIRGCLGCYACQNISGEYGCIQQDDMEEIVRSIQ